ncbi:hypothetical protein FQA39_LY16480 [Lamprigera yunnana]|nr:hypothetical protein FQA39_LY16480 [Lamprigera yunnana]
MLWCAIATISSYKVITKITYRGLPDAVLEALANKYDSDEGFEVLEQDDHISGKENDYENSEANNVSKSDDALPSSSRDANVTETETTNTNGGSQEENPYLSNITLIKDVLNGESSPSQISETVTEDYPEDRG